MDGDARVLLLDFDVSQSFGHLAGMSGVSVMHPVIKANVFVMPADDYEVSVGLQEGVSFDFTLDPTSPQTVALGSAEQVTITFEVTSATPSS